MALNSEPRPSALNSSSDFASPGPDPEVLLVACHHLIAPLTLRESHIYPPFRTHDVDGEPHTRFSLERDALSVKLVKALVAICNSSAEEHSPKYSIALTVTAERSSLYYASDESISTEVVEHAEACLAILRKISSACKAKFGLEVPPSSKQRSEDDDIHSAEVALIVRVYRFCFAYLRICVLGFEPKSDRFAQIVGIFDIYKKIARFSSNAEDFDGFCNKIGTLFGILENAVDHSRLSDEEVLDLNRLLRVISRSAKEEMISKVLEENTIETGVLGARCIEKICSLARSINILIHFAVSTRYRDIVEKFPDPIWIPLPLDPSPNSTFHAFLSGEVLEQWSKSLTCPLEEPSRLARYIAKSKVPPGLSLEDEGRYASTGDAYRKIHPECILVNYILDNDIDVYPVIGSSQVSCYPCEMYVHAVNKVYGKDFSLCDSSRSRMTLPWRYPARGVDDEVRASMAGDVFRDLATAWNARCADRSEEEEASIMAQIELYKRLCANDGYL